MRIGLFIIGYLFFVSVQAQTPSFSQYFVGNNINNPGFTGISKGQYQAFAGYRNQYYSELGSSSIQAMYFGADAKFHIDKDDFYSLGINFQTDQSGASKFTGTFANITGAYIKKLNGNRNGQGQYLSMGMNAGVEQYRVNKNSVWFGNQFNTNTSTLNTNTPSGEPVDFLDGNVSDLSPNIGLGVVFYEVIGNRKSYFIGLSLDNILTANHSLSSAENVLARKYTLILGGEYPIHQDLSILPSLMARIQGIQQIYTPGAQVRMKNLDRKDVALRFGSFFRLVNGQDISSESLILTTGLEYGHFLFGISYDLSLGPVNDLTGGDGAIEFAISYSFPYTQRKAEITCPKF